MQTNNWLEQIPKHVLIFGRAVSMLSQNLEDTRARPRTTCTVKPEAGAVQIRGLHYTRGPVAWDFAVRQSN